MSFWSTAYHVMAVITRSLTYTAGASFLLLSLLSPRSRRARLYLNVLLYVFSLGACSVLGMVVSPFMYLSTRSRLNINWLVARSFDKLAGNLIGLRFTLEGGEKFAKANPAVVVGNHQTGVDVLYLGRVFPRQTSIMAKRELKYAPVLGQFSGYISASMSNEMLTTVSRLQCGSLVLYLLIVRVERMLYNHLIRWPRR